MTSTVRAVLFDLDETLCVYDQSIETVLDAAFDAVDVAPFFEADAYVARFDEFLDAGDEVREVREACFVAFAEEDGHDAAVGRALADAYDRRRDPDGVSVAPGAREALGALADDYRLGLVTNGDPDRQADKLDSLGVADRFETVVYGGHDAPHKPDPEPFRVALADIGVDPEHAVHVGNSLESDVRGALAAGLQAVWVPRGERDSDPEPRPTYVCETLEDVAGEPWR